MMRPLTEKKYEKEVKTKGKTLEKGNPKGSSREEQMNKVARAVGFDRKGVSRKTPVANGNGGVNGHVNLKTNKSLFCL